MVFIEPWSIIKLNEASFLATAATAVERLFSAAGMIMEAKRNKLSPMYVDK